MRRLLAFLFFPCLLLFLLPACTQDLDGASPQLVTATQPIYGGSPATEPWHDSVTSLHRRSVYGIDQNGFCSGTLIAPRVVLTAGHCVDVAPGGRNYQTMSPSNLAIYVGGDAPYGDGNSAHWYLVSEIRINTNYDRRKLTDDIALVRLQTAVPSSVAVPVPGLPASVGFTQSDVGNLTLNFAGFGLDEFGGSDRKLQADGTLGGLGCTVSGCSGSANTATQISYTQYVNGPCYGDSGGPAFVLRGGTAYVGGITSYGDSYCTQYGASTRVDAYEAFITSFIGSVCGDAVCTPDETCNSCAADCGACPFCGDSTCDVNEDCATCSADCGTCVCGDGTCDATEDCGTCTADCGACPYCGDGTCDGSEDCSSCSADCGACPFCGDAICNAGENCSNCASDCGVCSTCGGNKATCSVNADCCSGTCRNGSCRGN